MSLPLPLTHKQPENWPRKRIDECFSISTSMSAATLAFEPGDILVRQEQGRLTATVVDQASTETSRQVARMRRKGELLPELMALMINHPDIQHSMRHTAQFGRSTFGFNAASLREMLIAVPDPQTQEMMVKAIQQSHGYLSQHTEHLRKQSDILERMANSILHQVLIGKADRKQALTWVSQALMPWLQMKNGVQEGVQTHSATEVASAGDDVRFVRLEDHEAEVAKWQARVRELEAGTTPAPSRPKP